MNLIIENAIIKNIFAYCIYIDDYSKIKIFDFFLDNINTSSFSEIDLEGIDGAIFISSDRYNYIYIENVSITNVWTNCASVIFDYHQDFPLNFTIKNSYFSNISIISGFYFLIELGFPDWSSMTIY